MQRRLGHKSAAYSMQHARITRAELNQNLDERGWVVGAIRRPSLTITPLLPTRQKTHQNTL